MDIFSQYNHPKSEGQKDFGESVTQQHFKEECDINTILKKYQQTGVMDVPVLKQNFGDFSEVKSYHEAQIAMQEAKDQFMTLPAAVRSKFENDPGALLDFVANPENKAEAISLGLIDNPVVPITTPPIKTEPEGSKTVPEVAKEATKPA
jgi:phage internal scaffolding protein